jgi:hypothetical protein
LQGNAKNGGINTNRGHDGKIPNTMNVSAIADRMKATITAQHFITGFARSLSNWECEYLRRERRVVENDLRDDAHVGDQQIDDE